MTDFINDSDRAPNASAPPAPNKDSNATSIFTDPGALRSETATMNDAITDANQQERKHTAEQIEKEYPERLRQIAKEIKERLSKADKQTEQAHNHLTAVEQLLKEAKSLCDEVGFEKFRELYCPALGKSQAYALLAIAGGKKTLAQHRDEERERKRRTRERKKAAAANSGTVPENSEPVGGAPCPGDGTRAAAEVSAEYVRWKTPPDEALSDFSASVMELIRRTTKQPVQRFATTSVSADDLIKLAKFLNGVAELKKSTAGKPRNDFVFRGNDVDPDASKEARSAYYAEHDAPPEQGAAS